MNIVKRVNIRESATGRGAFSGQSGGGIETEEADPALDAFIAEQERKRAATDSGSFFVTDGEQINPIGRDAWIARNAAHSRKPTGPAERAETTAADEEDSGGSAALGLTARDAWMERTARQSRQAVGGTRSYSRGSASDGAVVTELES